MSEQTEDLTEDAFLGGRLRLLQPRRGYRAGVDPVLLAASVPARPGDRVLELGCGAGAALFCLAARVPGLRLTGLELQPSYARLACRNALANGIEAEIVQGDLTAMPAGLKARSFDHVIANPPYYQRMRGSTSPVATREAAMGEATPLDDWVDMAARRLAPKGYLTMIQSAARLPDLLSAVGARLGSVALRPVQPRIGREAQLVLVQARKGGRAAFRLLAPLVMHEGAAHLRDGDDYSARARAILRDGEALDWE